MNFVDSNVAVYDREKLDALIGDCSNLVNQIGEDHLNNPDTVFSISVIFDGLQIYSGFADAKTSIVGVEQAIRYILGGIIVPSSRIEVRISPSGIRPSREKFYG